MKRSTSLGWAICLVLVLLSPRVDGVGTPTLRSITIDGQFADWNQILLNPVQVTNDGNGTVSGGSCYPTNPDRDCPNLSGTGRDVLTFAWTYDTTNIYTYLRRDGTTSAVMNYFFIMDLDADGLAEASDRVAQVRWSGGGNTLSYIRLFEYVPLNPAGDPMACAAAAACPAPGGIGIVDGYSMPGMLGVAILYDSGAQPGGSPNGDRFEVAIPWIQLGVAAGSPIYWHVASSTNASFNPAVDNAGGPDGRLGTFGVFAMTFEPDRSGAVASPGTIDYCHTVTNTGQFEDAYNLTVTSTSGSTVALYRADASCVRGALATDTNADGLPDTGTLAASASANVIVQLQVPPGLGNSLDRIRATATSTRRPIDVFASVVDTTAIGPVSVFPNLQVSGVAGNSVPIGPHTLQNNQATADTFDLRVASARG